MKEYAITVNYTAQVSPDDWSMLTAVLKVDEESNFKDILAWIEKYKDPNGIVIRKLESLKAQGK